MYLLELLKDLREEDTKSTYSAQMDMRDIDIINLPQRSI